MMGNLEVRKQETEMRERNEARGKLAVKPEGSQSFMKGKSVVVERENTSF